jgi:hypothetical protein
MPAALNASTTSTDNGGNGSTPEEYRAAVMAAP